MKSIYTIKLYTLLLSLLILFSSCDSYLDLSPEDGIAPNQISEDNITLFLNGLYRRATPNRDVYVLPDMRGGNYTWTALSGSSGSYGTMITGIGIDDRLGFSSTIWNNNYKIIYDANNIIEAADNLLSSNPDNTGELNRVKAEASFFRASSYYELVLSFGGVPIFESIITENIPRNSVEEVYEQVLTDLDFAIANTNSISSTGSTRVSKEAVQAFKARVLLQLGRKSEAAALAKDVISTAGLSLDADYGRIFRDTNSSTEVLFSFANLKSENNLRMSSLFWPYGTTWAGSYFVQPTEEVINELYSEDDIRKDVNILRIDNSDGTFNYIVSKYWDVQPVVILRLSEMYMICAEGLSNSEGLEYINQLRTLRGESALSLTDFNSDSKVVDAVLYERRKEFFSEGFLYYDYVRTGRATELSNTASERNILLPIPGTQINLSGGVLVQNPY